MSQEQKPKEESTLLGRLGGAIFGKGPAGETVVVVEEVPQPPSAPAPTSIPVASRQQEPQQPQPVVCSTMRPGEEGRLAREIALKISGYTIVPAGVKKALRVNRDWINYGDKQTAHAGLGRARWLLFIGDDPKVKPIPVLRAEFLDGVSTEADVMSVEKSEYICGRLETTTEHVRSAHLVTTGLLAYIPAVTPPLGSPGG